MTYEEVTRRLRAHLRETAAQYGLLDERVLVTARALSSQEAIGNPEHDDYPLIVGRERMMEADVRGARGQAFTDMYGRWEGLIRDICASNPVNNFRRAVLVATLNAAMRLGGEIEDTIHCKDDGPVRCAGHLASFMASEGLEPPIALIGYQPRFAESLAAVGKLRIVDMDVQHIGKLRAGMDVMGPGRTSEALRGARCAFVTGSTVVNGTIGRFLELNISTVFYGVTIVGTAKLLGLRHYCRPRS